MISSINLSKQLFAALTLILLNLTCVPAPVPRCSFFIAINKWSEYSNILADANPYFPVPPCEYGGPWQAIRAGDYESVFILARPDLIPRHNYYELLWFIRKGGARIGRIMRGEEPFIHDDNILREGYKHYTPYVRTRQLTGALRRPEIIDNKELYKKVIAQQQREIGNRNRGHSRPVSHKGPYTRPKRRVPTQDHRQTINQIVNSFVPINQQPPPHHQGEHQPHVDQQHYDHHSEEESHSQGEYEDDDSYQNIFDNLKPGFARNYEGGFFPGKRPEAESSNTDFEPLNSYHENQRSDQAKQLTPEARDFRPHQQVHRTKVLETPLPQSK